MKFELKTENDTHPKFFLQFFSICFSIAVLIIFCDVSQKLRIISRFYQIEYNCKLLTVDKSNSNFKKLSKISNLKSKQKIWEFCKEFIN